MPESSRRPDVSGVYRRLKEDLSRGVFAPGTEIPTPRALALRYGVPRDMVELALRRLFEQDVITSIGGELFAGAPGVILAPGFERPYRLSRLLGQYFSIRTEWPGLPIHIMVHDADLSQGTAVHCHDFCEITFVKAGAGFHVHEQQKYRIGRGDCFVVLPGEHHSYTSETSLEVRDVIFYTDLVEPFVERLERLPGFMRFFSLGPLTRRSTGFADKLHLDAAMQRTYLRITQELMELVNGAAPGHDALVLCRLVELIVLLSRQYDAREPGAGDARDEAPTDRLSAAKAFIQERHAQPITPHEVARFVYLSPSRLHHLFRQKLDMTLMEYVTRVRVEHARKLLSESRKAVTRVAMECGFSTPAHFSRIFTRLVGLSPRSYRAANQRTA